jgi:transcriptional regulator with XRE-family HTH domain
MEWTVGDVVRKIREHRRWSQTRLAKASNLNIGTVVAVEKNANTKRDTLEKIARGLGLTVADLYAMVPNPRETQRADRSSSATVGRQFPYDGPDRRREDLGPPPGLPERRRQA